MGFSEHSLKWKKITKTKKSSWKWQFLVMSHKIFFGVNFQTYLEPKFEVPSFKWRSYMVFIEHQLKWKKITKTQKSSWKWQFLVMSHEIIFWVHFQTYLEPKFEAPSFKNEEVIWFLVNTD